MPCDVTLCYRGVTVQKDPYRHITLRMPAEMVDKIEELAALHHRDRSGEIIHACALYIAAHEMPNTPESYYAILQALEVLRSKIGFEIEENKQKNDPKWVKVEEGWIE